VVVKPQNPTESEILKRELKRSGADYHVLPYGITSSSKTSAAEHTQRGFDALAAGQTKLAMHCFESAIELDDGFASAWIGLGWAQYQCNSLKEALTSIVEAEEYDPALVEKNRLVKASILVEYGHTYGVEDLIQKGIQIFEAIVTEDDAQAMAWYNLGNSHSALENYDQAVVCFKRSIDLQPDFPDAHVNLGIAYYHLGQHQPELNCYDRALEINPDHPQALISKGATLSSVYDKHTEAIDLYEHALSNATDFCRSWPIAWYNLACAYASADRYEKAYEAITHFQKIDPTASVESLLGHILSALWRENPNQYAEKAVDFFAAYVEARPDDRRARLELGEVFYSLQEYERALDAFPTIDLTSETVADAALLDRYAHCLSKSGQQEESLTYFARAAKIDPKYYHCYARQLLTLQRYSEALSAFRKVPQDHQKESSYLCDLGVCYANLDKEADALVAFNRAIEAAPEDGYAWYSLGLTCANRYQYRFALAALAFAGQLDSDLVSKVDRAAEEIRSTQRRFDRTFLRGLRSYLSGDGEGVDDEERAALRLLSYGDGYREQGRFDQASVRYRQALTYCRKGAYPWLSAAIKRRLAQVAQELGKFEQARTLYEEAFRLASVAQDELLIAEIGPEAGNILSTTGQYRRAIFLLETALELELRAERGILIASIQHDLAMTYYRSGDIVQAREMLYQALESSEKYDYDPVRVISWEGLGHCYRDIGLYLMGLEFYQKALAFHRDRDDLAGVGRVMNGMGVAYHRLEDYEAAVNTLVRSAEIKRGLANNVGLPDVYVNLGNVFTDLKAYDQARFYYHLARNQFADIGNAQGFVDATVNFGLSLEEEGILEQAIALYRETLAAFAEVNQALSAKLHYYVGQALWRNGQREEGKQNLHVAQKQARALGLMGLAESCRRTLASWEIRREQIEPSDFSLNESDSSETHLRAYDLRRALRAIKDGNCSLNDFGDEIKLRLAYTDPIVRIQGISLIGKVLVVLEVREDLWQHFKSLSEDPDALVRTAFCIYCCSYCDDLERYAEGVDILLTLTYDKAANVRAASISGLAELYPEVPNERRRAVKERISQMFTDEEDLVCQAAKRFQDQYFSEEIKGV
jgi:tetratricopeptide (TPR) repeat protein